MPSSYITYATDVRTPAGPVRIYVPVPHYDSIAEALLELGDEKILALIHAAQKRTLLNTAATRERRRAARSS